jgi:Na+-driven multidrug efflux pump
MMCRMPKPVAVFVSVTAGLVALFLAVVAMALGKNTSSSVDNAVVTGVWVAFGAVAIVAACAAFEALSARVATDHNE